MAASHKPQVMPLSIEVNRIIFIDLAFLNISEEHLLQIIIQFNVLHL
jgi:hypothetical protein